MIPMFRAVWIGMLACAAPSSLFSQTPLDWNALQQETVDLLQQFIRVDTYNPPGNETNGIRFLAGILDREGIPYETFEPASGRGNLVARLRGDGSRKALVLLNHVDVVPADANYWSVPPLSGVIKDGYIYGRGASDMKTLGIAEFVTFLALHRSGRPLKRDVIFVATADEEARGCLPAAQGLPAAIIELDADCPQRQLRRVQVRRQVGKPAVREAPGRGEHLPTFLERGGEHPQERDQRGEREAQEQRLAPQGPDGQEDSCAPGGVCRSHGAQKYCTRRPPNRQVRSVATNTTTNRIQDNAAA